MYSWCVHIYSLGDFKLYKALKYLNLNQKLERLEWNCHGGIVEWCEPVRQLAQPGNSSVDSRPDMT